MLRGLISFIRFFCFWLVFSIITRSVFELYFIDKLKQTSVSEIFQTFVYGLRIDASAAGYISVIPLLVFTINWLIPKTYIKPIFLRVYVYFCIFIISFVSILNLNIFREWGTKINFRVFETLYHSPSEAVASTGSSPIGLSLAIGLFLLVSGVILSNYIIDYEFKKPNAPFYSKLIAILLLIGMNVLIIRGGLQVAPMNQSMAYFSNKQILNQSALNTEWNLAHNIIEKFKTPYNPYLFMAPEKAAALVDSMYHVDKDTTIKILTTNRPNVVIFQLESFTADLIESLGGEKGITPYFENWIKKGVLFDSIYSSSDRTDKGIIAILSAFPSQATHTVIVDNGKQERLPALTATFRNQKYHTSYYYGGESEYMNFKAYVLSHHTKDVIDIKNFAQKEVTSKWGVFDDVLLKKQVQKMINTPQPFFSYVQTSTNHEPFDLPRPPKFPGEDLSNKFRSTAYYTNEALKEYFDEASKQEWYKNTLFIFIADHGHRLPRNDADPYEPQKYHIPMLFFGDVIKPEYQGKKITKLGNQTDMAATLLAQLDIPNTEYKWSKNLLNPYSKPFTFFVWDNGFGFMNDKQEISYDNAGQKIAYIKDTHLPQSVTGHSLLLGKAFMQQVFTEYMNL